MSSLLGSGARCFRRPVVRSRLRRRTPDRFGGGRHPYACNGCHSIAGSGGRVGPALDKVGARLRPAYLYAFLKDPKGIIPGTPMKDFDLWDEEARSLTAYLSTLKRERDPASE